MIEDEPILPQFWTSRVPESLQWTSAELDPESTLDELCVELEVITGTPAITTRTILLSNLSLEIKPYTNYYSLEKLFQGCPRLAIWCALNTVTRFEEMPPFIATYYNVILEWCYGRITKESFEKIHTAWSIETINMRARLTGVPNLQSAIVYNLAYDARVSMMTRDAEKIPFMRKSIENALRCLEQIGEMEPDRYLGTKLAPKFAEHVITFPVSER